MRWRGRRRSSNVEDRRGGRAGGPAIGGLGLLLLIVLGLFFGIDPATLLQVAGGAGGGGAPGPAGPPSADTDDQAQFTQVVLASTEDAWRDIFARGGGTYREPKLVLFTGRVQSACGFQSAAVGPFYCPGDQNVYIDLSFYAELRDRFGAPGDFAQAYVIAHEVGHHVQNLLGVSDQVRTRQQRASQAEANALSVRLELQADCLAGMWANNAARLPDFLEPGDLEEGLRAAAAIGDDQIQMRTQGYVVPESFTHGSAEQRMRWFRLGVTRGSFEACNTFDGGTP